QRISCQRRQRGGRQQRLLSCSPFRIMSSTSLKSWALLFGTMMFLKSLTTDGIANFIV
ncbi:hypothetical protein S83_067106, partial [Arachis hypogaea]